MLPGHNRATDSRISLGCVSDGRPLTQNERALVDGLLAQSFEGVEALREQAKNLLAGTTPACTCGCGTIDLLPQGDAPRSHATSPVASGGAVRDEAGAEVGGLLLFLEDGRLASLEVYSYDEPLPLPSAERVRWFPARG